MSDLRSQLSLEAQRIEEDTEHTFKAHYNASTRWSTLHLWIGLPAAILAAISGAAAFNNYPNIAGSLAIISTALTTVLTFLKPSERSEIHKSVAGQYQSLRNRARMFREIELVDDAEFTALKQHLLELAKERDDLNQTSPSRVARRAYYARSPQRA